MKNKIIIFLVSIFFFQSSLAENLNIKSTSISIDKNTKITIFKNDVVAEDAKKNIFKTNYAEYNKSLQLLNSKGKTTILTSEGYFIIGKNIVFDNKNNIIKSSYSANVKDLENNNIFLQNFEYSTEENFFKSTGEIKVVDLKNNTYNFSQIYIDEKKREIVGTDIKALLNDKDFLMHRENKPRVFANTVKMDDQKSEFTKSIFTLCNYRDEDKCPPWSVQATQMTHDKKSKTIYYENAVIKVFDVPIFYTPRLSHPDPSVNRRSGFLPPSFSDGKNLGPGFEIPYFWALNKDKDLTFTSKLFSSENPLFLGAYRQAFKESNLILDFGFTEGYKKNTSNKKSGQKSHFFSKFTKNFKGKNNSENNLEVTMQELSNDKYLKLYKIKSDLVEYDTDTLENSLNFVHTTDDIFLGLNASAYENLKEGYNDKYEYILPNVLLDKNLFSKNEYGVADLQTNFKIHNYDTNKTTKFLVNDVNWKSKNNDFNSGLRGRLLGKFRNINYETKNISSFKKDTTSEMFGALGYLSEIDLYKNTDYADHLLKPKILFRYAPSHMRKEKEGARLNHLNLFTLDRLNNNNNFEGGLSSTVGFDYKLKDANKELDFSLGQIINEKENKKMPDSSSLNEKLSDVVGTSSLSINENIKLNYNFAVDQNYKDLNYNELSANYDYNTIKFNLSYLQEKKHIGNQEYAESQIDYIKGDNGLFSFKAKRNLITNSAEYYNLSYEYINDCLRAGIVYRREFYNDSELEAENSLMFKITLVPFGNINSPSFDN
jgi:LPS-assembly protein